MKQINIRVSPTDPTLDSKKMFVTLLKMNGAEGKTVVEMATILDLIDKIEASSNDAGIILKDSEYDLLKATYEKNKFPMNDRFFTDVWKDIKDYSSVAVAVVKKPDADETSK